MSPEATRCSMVDVNSKLDQWQDSQDAGRKNLLGQRPGLNSSIKKLLPLLYKGGVNWLEKNAAYEKLPGLFILFYK